MFHSIQRTFTENSGEAQTDEHLGTAAFSDSAQLLAAHRAQATAEAIIRRKDNFIALVAHELRNPLNSILGYTHLLKLQPNLSDKVQQMLALIERNGQAQLQVINDLLDHSRMMNGKLKLEARSLDFSLVLQDAIKFWQPLITAKNITLVVQASTDVPALFGDAARLQQVIGNLLSNAVKFTPEGGTIAVKVWNDTSHLHLQITDTGKGIAPEFLPYLFQQYSQFDITSHRRESGLGLGLALVQHLVELHAGTVTAASDGANCGATFTVSLPLRKRSEAENIFAVEDPMALAVVPPLSGIKIILIADELATQQSISTALGKLDVTVALAASSSEILPSLQVALPQLEADIFLMDLGVEADRGYQVMREIRSLSSPLHARLPAIALSAFSRVDDRIRSLRAGFQIQAAKPVDLAELATMIAALVPLKQ